MLKKEKYNSYIYSNNNVLELDSTVDEISIDDSYASSDDSD